MEFFGIKSMALSGSIACRGARVLRMGCAAGIGGGTYTATATPSLDMTRKVWCLSTPKAVSKLVPDSGNSPEGRR
jgi:hypothetical protein